MNDRPPGPSTPLGGDWTAPDKSPVPPAGGAWSGSDKLVIPPAAGVQSTYQEWSKHPPAAGGPQRRKAIKTALDSDRIRDREIE